MAPNRMYLNISYQVFKLRWLNCPENLGVKALQNLPCNLSARQLIVSLTNLKEPVLLS
jgi:hypothetical protein